jgi:hypothetical protein
MDVAPTGFYQNINASLFCQGDVFGCVPLVYFRADTVPVKWVTLHGGKQAYAPQPAVTADTPVKDRTKQTVLAGCDYTRAVLMTHGCEIDKPVNKFVTVAIIRSFQDLQENVKDALRGNRKLSAFYLPPHEQGQPETYIDFRSLSTIEKDVLTKEGRICSLSEISSMAMLGQMVQFFARRKLDLNQMEQLPDC